MTTQYVFGVRGIFAVVLSTESHFEKNMGKARQRKRNKSQIIENLTGAEFQAHIQKTLGVSPRIVEDVMPKLIQKAREGVTNYWLGMKIRSEEIRIGYESDGNCYTMIVINGVGSCYDFARGNTCTPVRCIPFPPSKTSVYPLPDGVV